jgi:hypothetical protein
MEDDGIKGKTREMFAKVKMMNGKFTPRMGTLRGGEWSMIKDGEGVKERWREYTEELYRKDLRVKDEQLTKEVYEKEPVILESEVEWAICQLKDNKAPGMDGIPIEMIRAGGDEMVRKITLLCNRIWETGEWPKGWKNSVFIPIFKKGDAKDCGNYRTIALISHTSKILLKILHKRMESTVERELPANQAGFRKGRGT